MASTIRLHWRGHLRSILSDPPRKKRKHSKNMNEILFLRGKFKRNTHYDNFCVFNAFLCKYGDLSAKTGSACKRNAFRENETLKKPDPHLHGRMHKIGAQGSFAPSTSNRQFCPDFCHPLENLLRTGRWPKSEKSNCQQSRQPKTIAFVSNGCCPSTCGENAHPRPRAAGQIEPERKVSQPST